ncbi:MAG: tetratricopeptide (TPR) repeat protein [Parvicellaceae bacterium]|jgi:tetratricopeptide (TPR) repeat protein
MYKLIIFFTSCWITSFSYGCINEYEHEHNHYHGIATDDAIPNVKELRTAIQRRISDTSYFLTNYEMGLEDSLTQLSDYASMLVYAGYWERAKVIFQRIEREWPNQYTTASNLGTVYELLGKPDSALIWIQHGYNLDPNSHGGSEWIHLKILEYKLSSKESTEDMFNLFQVDADGLSIDEFSPNEIAQHFFHQLNERLYFIDGPNQILAQMYFELGQILTAQSVFQNADTLFQIAETYGYNSVKVAASRVNIVEKKAKQIEDERLSAIKGKEDVQRAKSDMLMLIVFGLIGVVSIIIICFVIFKIVKSNRRKRGELIEVERSR